MMALVLARDAARKAHAAVLDAIQYEGLTFETHDADTMLQDVVSQLNKAIRARLPDRSAAHDEEFP
jgi:hypothetical protein